MKKFFQDFGKFISKGNALDLAVGIVIGGAFNAIIKSLVADIITPLIGLLVKADITQLKLTLHEPVGEAPGVYLTYGNFIQSVFDFLIIALAIFLALRVIMRLQKNFDKIKGAIADKVLKSDEQSN